MEAVCTMCLVSYIVWSTEPWFRGTSFINSVIWEETIGATNGQVDDQVKL